MLYSFCATLHILVTGLLLKSTLFASLAEGFCAECLIIIIEILVYLNTYRVKAMEIKYLKIYGLFIEFQLTILITVMIYIYNNNCKIF